MTDAVEEYLVHTREEAQKRAKENHENGIDPFDEIPPSLLSSDHIEQYVKKTGLIWPFHLGGDKKKERLKRASYEGRIGDSAYKYNEDDELVSIPVKDKPLIVKANSIVFVECNLEFRLPKNIALRFNLQIRHVHRGLLLGTGPLVDPGYWGKLCIPLHNLTSEDYSIPYEEGLIWVEFTKTTSMPTTGREALTGDLSETLEKNPEENGHWKITKFIDKAAQPFDTTKPLVGIRSSIPLMAIAAEQNSAKAAKEAKDASMAGREAQRAAQKAEISASNSEIASKQTEKRFERVGLWSAIGVVIAAIALWLTFFFGTVDQIASASGRIDQTQNITSALKNDFKTIIDKNTEIQGALFKVTAELNDLRGRLKDSEQNNKGLQSRVDKLQEQLDSQTHVASPNDTKPTQPSVEKRAK